MNTGTFLDQFALKQGFDTWGLLLINADTDDIQAWTIEAMEAYHAQFSQQPTEKGINLEPYPQTENTNIPTLQSDSVDADIKPFLEFIAKERDAFVARFLMYPKTIETRVAAENLLIAYDQMKERLAGSKVKSINEKMREALEKSRYILIDLTENGDHDPKEAEDALKIIESALSTAPDDKFNL